MSTTDPSWYQPVGITLAILSGAFIGLSLILQKKGLLDSKGENNDTHAHLKNPLWWLGIVSMSLGEIFNFVAYSFVPATTVTPLGAVSVVVSAVLSVFFLKEKLNFSGTMGIVLCVFGATLIVLYGPKSTSSNTIPDFFSYVLAPGFIAYAVLCLGFVLYMIYRVGPRYGHVHPLVYISITSVIGSFLVNSAQGMGSSIVYTINGKWDTDNQFLQWPLYPLLAFVLCTVVLQIDYLNRGLRYFSTSIITPIYYVFFSTCTLITSSVLYRGFQVDSATSAITVVIGFLTIVIGVSLLFQYNLKITKLTNARYVEDIVDVDQEDDDRATDQSPFKILSESFPIHPIRSTVPMEVRPPHATEEIDVSGENYVRSVVVVVPGHVRHESAPTTYSIVPSIGQGLVGQLQRDLEKADR